MDALRLTPETQKKFQQLASAAENKTNKQDVYLKLPPVLSREGYHFIIPAFFELLLHLQKQGRDFAIVFRTFGSDIPEVAAELNLFCTGQHPCYPHARFDGTNGTMDLRLHFPQSTAVLHRSDSLISIISGTHIAVKNVPSAPLPKDISIIQVPISKEKSSSSTLSPVLDFIVKNAFPESSLRRSFSLGDCYQYWAQHLEHSSAGKLLVVNNNDNDSSQVEQIFLDDNIEEDDAHIVDVRYESGEIVPFAQALNKYIFRVDPLAAIFDSQYFIRALQVCKSSM